MSRSSGNDEAGCRRPGGALTTGQAARYCFVTSDTIANWIKSGLLRAQRTAGGQYRILLGELREFMLSRGMSTHLLDDQVGHRPPCWVFRAGDAGAETSACRDCIVQFLGVRNCYRLMAMRPGEERPCRDCAACPYFQRWGEEAPDDGEPVKEVS